MPTDKSLYNLYLKEMKATGLQVNKKLAAFADSFANRVLSEPNNDIAKIYRQEVKAFNIVDDVAKTIQGGMINQTAIGYGILPDFSAEIMGNNSTANLKKIFGKTNGKKLSKSVYNSVADSQKTIYQTIEKNSKLNKTWKETSSQVRKELKGSLKGYENLPKNIKKLEDIGQKALSSGDSRQFKKRLEKARLKIEDLSDNRALKQSYKSVFNQLEKAIDKNDKVLFEKGIKQATFAKNQSFAERTIITEQSRVYEQSRYNERVENELITAVKFNLSSSHKKVDQCDVIASYNSGLGSGVYSLKSQPAMPIHPNGVSFLTDILVDEVSQKQADKFKYNRNGIAEAAERKNLSPSQVKDVENMIFQQTMGVDKKELTKVVKEPKKEVKKPLTQSVKIGFNGKFDKYTKNIRYEAGEVIKKVQKPDVITTNPEFGKTSSFKPTLDVLNFQDNSRSIFLHEYGHNIDYKLGKKLNSKTISVSDGFLKARELDVNHQKQMYKGENILQAMKNKWKGKKEFEGASDMIDSFSGGVFHDNYGMAGHGKSYYAKKGKKNFAENKIKRQTEIFANMFQGYSEGGKTWENIKIHFPNNVAEFEKVIKDVLNE